MKVEVTLTSDEYKALSTAPGRSAQQRLRWLVKFWGAVCDERESKQKLAEIKAEKDAAPKLEVIEWPADAPTDIKPSAEAEKIHEAMRGGLAESAGVSEVSRGVAT